MKKPLQKLQANTEYGSVSTRVLENLLRHGADAS
jgi:hypothetical protein